MKPKGRSLARYPRASRKAPGMDDANEGSKGSELTTATKPAPRSAYAKCISVLLAIWAGKQLMWLCGGFSNVFVDLLAFIDKVNPQLLTLHHIQNSLKPEILA